MVVLIKKDLAKSGGYTFVNSKATKIPYSPNIAPDAPTLTVASYHHILVTLAKIPVNKYTVKYFVRPSSGSKKMPTNKRPNIFDNMCINPPCKNVLVRS